MRKKAQALMIILWILVILTVLAVSVGYRVSLGLRLNRYQRDGLKAFCLAHAGINRAIVEIVKDKNSAADYLKDSWADNQTVFEKISLSDNPDEFATVSYQITDKNNQTQDIYGAQDEERKININTAPEGLLTEALKQCEIEEAKAKALAHDILIWCGSLPADSATSDFYTNNLGYPCKRAAFTVPEELVLVKGMQDIERQNLEKLKTLITVYGTDKKVNINTASEEVLRALALSAVSAGISPADAEGVAGALMTFKGKTDGYFNSTEINDVEKIRQKLFSAAGIVWGAANSDNKTKIIENLISAGLLTAVSDNFRIEVIGSAAGITKKITVVYSRKDKKTIFWHQD